MGLLPIFARYQTLGTGFNNTVIPKAAGIISGKIIHALWNSTQERIERIEKIVIFTYASAFSFCFFSITIEDINRIRNITNNKTIPTASKKATTPVIPPSNAVSEPGKIRYPPM